MLVAIGGMLDCKFLQNFVTCVLVKKAITWVYQIGKMLKGVMAKVHNLGEIRRDLRVEKLKV